MFSANRTALKKQSSAGPLPLSCHTNGAKVLSIKAPSIPAPLLLKEYQSKSNHPQQPPGKARVLLDAFFIRWRRPRESGICFFGNGWDMGHFSDLGDMVKSVVKSMTMAVLFFVVRLILGRWLLSVVDGICNPWCLPAGEVIDNSNQIKSNIPEGRSFLFCSVDKGGRG